MLTQEGLPADQNPQRAGQVPQCFTQAYRPTLQALVHVHLLRAHRGPLLAV